MGLWSKTVAQRLLQESEATMTKAVFILGRACSGKTTLALAMAHKARAVYLDKDTMVSEFTRRIMILAGEPEFARDESHYYTNVVRPLEYSSLLAVGSSNLQIGQDVIFDAPFTPYLKDREFLDKVIKKHKWPEQVESYVIYVETTKSELQKRMRARNLNRDSWKLKNWDRYWEGSALPPPEWAGSQLIRYINDAEAKPKTLISSIFPDSV